MTFVPGQRWISTAEPELGLGTVLRIEGRSVQILYSAAEVIRHYAQSSAPLLRVEFKPGDRINAKGKQFLVEHVMSQAGLLHYSGNGITLTESELEDIQNVSKADERLLSGRVDRVDQFEFRIEALQRRADARRAPTYGIASSRVTLIPHQLRIAEIASKRRPPRILLADEVGLGKTIEAGLIVAHALANGRTTRVLVLLPETLVHQWFVELLRRFNLSFSIFDEERCQAIEQEGNFSNPFEDEQWVIAPFALVINSAKRAQQLIEAGWDLLVVDEAHHLAWSPEWISPEYTLVEQLAHNTPGVILLTATPEQLGRSGHFARLRLLDPARYSDLKHYQQEAESYVQLSQIAKKIQKNTELTSSEQAELTARFSEDVQLQTILVDYAKGDQAAGESLLNALIDRHGTGRVMFRNRRAQIGGFPQRQPQLRNLDGALLDETQRQKLLAEFLSDMQEPPTALDLNYAEDPRLPWLLEILEQLGEQKLLLICRSQAKVLALEEALRTRSGVKLARFHEGMTIVQRDRNAAYFADPEGARILLCAEIGSEGRNFQFAHHLLLWDLPLDPDLLEQRIGRLDRIGQDHDICLHAASFGGSAQHVLTRWYDQGLDAFRTSPADGREVLKRFRERLLELAIQQAHGAEEPNAEIDALIAETSAVHSELSALIHAGRDHLLELSAAREAPAEILRQALITSDANLDFDAFVLQLFEQFGVQNDEHGPRIYLLDPEYLSTDGFPGLQEGPQTVTFDRATALAREELPLLRADHPMVAGALDLLLSGELGNCCFFVDDTLKPKTVLLECVFVLECVAKLTLNIERFLPPTPLHVIVDTKRQPRPDYRADAVSRHRAKDRKIEVTRYRKFLSALTPPMLECAQTLALQQAQTEVNAALSLAENQLGGELKRLTALHRINPSVRPEEIAALSEELTAIRTALAQTTTRLDSIRFVCSADFLSLR